MIHIIDRQGNPIDLKRYIELLGDLQYKVVKHTTSEDGGILVSTIWQGIVDIGPFETMVFFRQDHPDQNRFSKDATEESSLVTHEEYVKQYITKQGE